jgi:hypothetical protein
MRGLFSSFGSLDLVYLLLPQNSMSLSGWGISEVEKLQESWQKEYQVSCDNSKSELVLALLTIKKAKQYWLQVEPPEDNTSPPERYRGSSLLFMLN